MLEHDAHPPTTACHHIFHNKSNQDSHHHQQISEAPHDKYIMRHCPISILKGCSLTCWHLCGCLSQRRSLIFLVHAVTAVTYLINSIAIMDFAVM